MSTHRTSGYRECVHDGPYIKGTCRFCGKKVKPPRRNYCDDNCVDGWLIRTDPRHVRHKLSQRDNGVCGRCGLDTIQLTSSIRALQLCFSRGRLSHGGITVVVDGKKVETWKSLWEAHHKKAVVEGGGECGLDGYETLCLWCHQDETASLARRRADDRRADKEARDPQMKLVDVGGKK